MNLNTQQKDAVEYYGTPQIIIAGAGTGKTTVMIEKIKHLIATKKHAGKNILALTFTNKAANEMKERFQQTSSTDDTPTFGTFHSFCLRFLKKIAHRSSIGIPPTFSIIDHQKQREIISGLIKKHPSQMERKPKDMLSKLSNIKQLPRHMHANALADAPSDINAIFSGYNQALRDLNCLDFDDLLLFTHEILSTQPDILEQLNHQFTYIIIDEYQDTNQIQNDLSILLAKKHNNICVVGDFDQTIYSWRGAKIENLLQFNHHFPTCKTQKLEINYRSTNEILSSANQLIEFNSNRQPKQLIGQRNGQNKPEHIICFNESEEATTIAEKIKSLQKETSYKLSDIAILYRTNQQARAIEEALIHHQIPHQIVGTTPFYQRMEIKHALAYLHCIHNINQPIWFERAILNPPKGIGKASLHSLFEFSTNNNLTIEAAIHHDQCPLKPRAMGIAKSFVDQITQVSKSPTSIDEKLKTILETMNVDDAIKKHDDYIDRRDNIKELLSKLSHVTNLADFLDETALFQGNDAMTKTEKVSCLTLHLAKGLEFSVVFIPGFEQDIMPLKNSESLEEERRLAYVGITRGKNHVVLLSSYKRT